MTGLNFFYIWRADQTRERTINLIKVDLSCQIQSSESQSDWLYICSQDDQFAQQSSSLPSYTTVAPIGDKLKIAYMVLTI